MTTEAQALAWMPYKVVGIHPEVSPTCFIGSASALRINGTECIVVTRGRVDLDAVLEALTENDYDIEQRYAVCVLHSDSVEVELPEVPEQLPVALPAAEKLEQDETTPIEKGAVDETGVPIYQGGPVVKYLDPMVEANAVAPQGDTVDDDGNAVVHGEDDDDEL